MNIKIRTGREVSPENLKLYDLVDSQDPQAIFDEISTIIKMINAEGTLQLFRNVFFDIVKLFNGAYPGYRASNTKYHNLEHTLLVTLASTRLIHGCTVAGYLFDDHGILVGLLSALYHDCGLIQTTDDTEGTGAKYTVGHEERSVAFMKQNLGKWGAEERLVRDCAIVIRCTNLDLPLSTVAFPDAQIELLARIVASSDLIAQMADRHYLEKLVLLFKEFEEAGIPGFASEEDLLRKTEGFYKDVVVHRLSVDLGNVAELMRHHFEKRWGINRDLYQTSIHNNISYLKSIFENNNQVSENYTEVLRKYLKRGGIVKDPDPAGSNENEP